MKKEIKERVRFDFSDIEAKNKLRKALSDELDGIKIENGIPVFEDWDIKEVKFNKETNKVDIHLQVKNKVEDME